MLAQGSIWNGSTLEDAENTHLPDVHHFGSPTHPYTLEMLARELSLVAATVPVVELLPRPLPGGEEPPTPRPVPPQARRTTGEWDFLRPVSRLGGQGGTEVFRAARPQTDAVPEP